MRLQMMARHLWPWATDHNTTISAKLLLAAGADVSAINSSNKKTPLYRSVVSGHADMVRIIMQSESWLQLDSEARRTQEFYALASAQTVKVITAVVDCAPALDSLADLRDCEGGTPLHVAAAKGPSMVVVCKLTKLFGFDVKAQCRGHTVTEWATQNGHALLARLLERAAQT